MYRETKKNVENRAMANSSAVTLMPLIERRRKMPGNGTSGALVARSIATKPTSSAVARAIMISVWAEPQPAELAFTREYTSSDRPAVTVTAPATSKWRWPSTRLSGSRRGASTAAAMPIGTLTNRTHSQPAHSVSMPPSRTPAAPPEPATAPHTPMARLRSAPSSKSTVTSERAAGDSSAAPRPWTARAEISHTSFWARPPAREAPANRMRPAMNIRRRPSRSAMRPPSSRKPPKVSVYALTTHDRLSWEKSRALPMDGRATLTMEASSTTTNCAAASRTSASQRRSGEVLKACAPGEIEGKWKRSSGFTSQDTELTFRLSSPTLELVTKVVHRPLRADARRNRERVLSAAREVFGEQGREAQMDDV